MAGRPPAPLPPPPQLGTLPYCAWGTAQLPSRKDEDRVLVLPAPGCGADLALGVFDGHNGKRAALACEQRLLPVLAEELARLTGDVAVTDAAGWPAEVRRVWRTLQAPAGPWRDGTPRAALRTASLPAAARATLRAGSGRRAVAAPSQLSVPAAAGTAHWTFLTQPPTAA